MLTITKGSAFVFEAERSVSVWTVSHPTCGIIAICDTEAEARNFVAWWTKVRSHAH